MELNNAPLATRIRLLKHVEAFKDVDPARLEEIASRLEEWETPQNTIIFNQGEVGDYCYLIYKGKVEVLLKKANGQERMIAELDDGDVFGEIALLTENKRNATVKSLTDCTLLRLTSKQFKYLIQSATSSEKIIAMLLDRYHPVKAQEISIHHRKDNMNNNIVILKNHRLGTYFKTSVEGLFVWNLLDGEHTLQDVAMAFFYQYHRLATDDIGTLILRLMNAGFVNAPRLAGYVPQPKLPLWMKVLNGIRSVMQYEYAIKEVDAGLSRLYKKAGYLFFNKIAFITMGIMAFCGTFAFLLFSPLAIATIQSTPYAWVWFIMASALMLLIIPLHELAHALTTKYYGFQVHRFGVGWFWLGPMAFADTSDMWLATKRQRMMVNVAGVYLNIIVSGMLSLVMVFFQETRIFLFLWLAAFSGYLLAFYNLNPLLELDGYYVLVDILDKPNLRAYAIDWLLTAGNSFKNWRVAKQHLPEIFYWLIAVTFVFFEAMVAYLLQNYILSRLLPPDFARFNDHHLWWVFSSIVILLSFGSLYSRIRKQRYLHIA